MREGSRCDSSRTCELLPREALPRKLRERISTQSSASCRDPATHTMLFSFSSNLETVRVLLLWIEIIHFGASKVNLAMKFQIRRPACAAFVPLSVDDNVRKEKENILLYLSPAIQLAQDTLLDKSSMRLHKELRRTKLVLDVKNSYSILPVRHGRVDAVRRLTNFFKRAL